MQAPEAAESFAADARAFQIRQHNTARVADDNVFDVTASIDEHTNLPIDLSRNLGEMPREFLCNDVARMDAPLIELLQAVDLAWLQSLQVTFYAYGCLLWGLPVPHIILHQTPFKNTAILQEIERGWRRSD